MPWLRAEFRVCRLPRLLAAATLLSLGGCQWVNTRSDFDRDPFVMSHLTHAKNDPLFAGSDNEAANDLDRQPIQSASTSRKLARENAPFQQMSYQSSPNPTKAGHASDHRWLKGQLTYRDDRGGSADGWYLRYGRKMDNDPYGGELRIANTPKLGMLREGDEVVVEGKVIQAGLAEPRYQVESIALVHR